MVTGPNTVVAAIAAGTKAATMIARYLRGEELRQPREANIPRCYVAPQPLSEEERRRTSRATPPLIPVPARRRSLSEVELGLSPEAASLEARRCLRCDLEFTQPGQEDEPAPAGVQSND